MADPQDRVDIPGIENPAPVRAPRDSRRREASAPESRRWLGILFNCCRVYGRIYREDHLGHYRGRCPSCGTDVSVPIGPGGTNRRFFETTQ